MECNLFSSWSQKYVPIGTQKLLNYIKCHLKRNLNSREKGILPQCDSGLKQSDREQSGVAKLKL